MNIFGLESRSVLHREVENLILIDIRSFDTPNFSLFPETEMKCIRNEIVDN